jgi:hypothetical protein
MQDACREGVERAGPIDSAAMCLISLIDDGVGE